MVQKRRKCPVGNAHDHAVPERTAATTVTWHPGRHTLLHGSAARPRHRRTALDIHSQIARFCHRGLVIDRGPTPVAPGRGGWQGSHQEQPST